MENKLPTDLTEFCIQLERCEDGYWEYAVWIAKKQLTLGHRDTYEEASQAAIDQLKEHQIDVYEKIDLES